MFAEKLIKPEFNYFMNVFINECNFDHLSFSFLESLSGTHVVYSSFYTTFYQFICLL